MSQATCTNNAYINRLAINIARKFQDPDSQMKVSILNQNRSHFKAAFSMPRKHYDHDILIFVCLQCCTTSGCNWSWDTAANNQALSAADTSDDTTLFAFVGAIVFGLLVLLSCLLFCFIYFWRSKKEEDAKVSTFYGSIKCLP